MPLWRRAGFLVRRLHQISVAIFLREMEGLDLTPVQLGALTVVLERPGIDQSALGAELGIDRANGADVVARLDKLGLLTREPSQRDRRMRELRITDAGRGLVERANVRLKFVQSELLAPLDDGEKEEFIRLATKIVENNNELGRAVMRLGARSGPGSRSGPRSGGREDKRQGSPPTSP
ncbi:regulatory protein MarR [Stappia sp. 22II-S9-Z10]|nr:regulatory protein MarR [Stappia sp. 22II-S9-Z10]